MNEQGEGTRAEPIKFTDGLLTSGPAATGGPVTSGPVATSGSAISIGDHQAVRFTNVYQLVGEASANSIEGDELKSSTKPLLAKIDEYYDLIAEELHDNQCLQEDCLRRLESAQRLLQQAESKGESENPAFTLVRAQFEVRRVHVAIAKEQKARRGELRLRWIVPTLVVVYVAAIIAVIVFGQHVSPDTAEIPIIGVPLSVIVWAAIGSVAAILYRFYTLPRGRVHDETRWLIARPIFGIIMGALVYLAVVSGLLIFGNSTGTDASVQNASSHLLWAMAFLGGFSDKLFQKVIDAVSGTISAKPQEETSQ